MNRFTLPRVVSDGLKQRLAVMPAVVITGARQTGKSTLVQDYGDKKRRLFSLDDLDLRASARNDPEMLIGGATPVTIDEIQREPDLLLAIKREIDSDRKAGQFLLTGSANLLLMGRVSESLAGRASYMTLWPMTRREQMGVGQCGIWEKLFKASDKDWFEIVNQDDAGATDWRKLAKRGGFPTPAVHIKTSSEREIWFDGYVRTYLERDLQDIASIDALPDFRRLMRIACHRLGGLINQTEMGRDSAIPQPTVHRYLNLLETSYMMVRLPAYSVNRTKRLVKSPKLYWADTGIAIYLAGAEEVRGEHLENLILADLLTWRDSRLKQADIFYWRTTIGEEVDFVIESDGKVLPIEIKSTRKPKLADVKNLRAFRKEYGETARTGLLLHDGESVEWMAPDVLAAPWWKVI